MVVETRLKELIREQKAVTHVGLMENVENYDDCHYFYEDEVSNLALLELCQTTCNYLNFATGLPC